MTDLGTEFGVEVQDDGTSEVHVLAGQVELQPQVGSNRVRLAANSAARVEVGSGRVVKVQAAPKSFVRTMPTLAGAKTVMVEWRGMLPKGSFVVADNDLLQTSLASATTDQASPGMFPGQMSLSVLYDGKLYGPHYDDPFYEPNKKLKVQCSPSCDGSFSFANGKSATFVLDTRVHKHGYTIDAIDLYTGHVCTRVGQKYKVEFGQVGQEGWLSRPVVNFDHRGLWSDFETVWEACSHIHARPAGLPLATGIDRIRFTFYDQCNPNTPGWAVESIYREIDVIGSPTGKASSDDNQTQPQQRKETNLRLPESGK